MFTLSALGVATTDPRIDLALQKQLAELRKTDPYSGDAGRSRWAKEGKRDEWIRDFAKRVRRIAPQFGLKPTPTDKFVTAHAALSTGYGRSLLARVANNPFGIKGTNAETWPGPIIYSGAVEYEDGVPYSTTAVWRVYKGDAGIVDHLRLVTDPDLRYAKAGEKLRRGELDYMAQLGRDGWYTDVPEKINAMWLDIMGYVEDVLAATPPEPAPKIPIPVFAGLALAAGMGLAYLVATYVEPTWRGHRLMSHPGGIEGSTRFRRGRFHEL